MKIVSTCFIPSITCVMYSDNFPSLKNNRYSTTRRKNFPLMLASGGAIILRQAKSTTTAVGKRSWSFLHKIEKPKASEVLTCHLESNKCPPWTSYFVKYNSIVNDQWGKSHFNWLVGNGKCNYHVLRTGCFPYIKYHCTQRPIQDLKLEDTFFRLIKVINLGIPCLAYGLAFQLYKNKYIETVMTSHGPVQIYFHYQEDKGSSY